MYKNTKALTCLSHAVTPFDFLKGENWGSGQSGHSIFIILPNQEKKIQAKRMLTTYVSIEFVKLTVSQTAGQTGANLLCCLSREPGCSSVHPDVRFHPHPVLQRLWHVVQLESSKSPSSERSHCCSAHLFDHVEEQSDTWQDLLADMHELSSIPSCLSTMCSRASSSPMNFTSNTFMVSEKQTLQCVYY